MASASVLMHPDYIIWTGLSLSGLYNPELSFTTPFVDFQRSDLHVLDYIIRKFSTISGLYNLNPSIHNWHHHPSGWMKCQNPRINPKLIIRTRGIFGRKKKAREERHRVGKVNPIFICKKLQTLSQLQFLPQYIQETRVVMMKEMQSTLY